MPDNLSNDFWGLQRRFPRFCDLPRASLLETCAMGALVGTLLVSIAYCVQLIWFDEIQQWRPFTENEYLAAFAGIWGIPVLLGAVLCVLLNSTHPDPNLTDDIPFRAFRVALMLLREQQRLGVIDWLFIVLLPILSFIDVEFLGISLEAHWRDWPVGIAPLITGLLLRTFRKNPFQPVTHPIEIPSWIDTLLPGNVEDPTADEEKRARRTFCHEHAIVDRDDCIDPRYYFRYSFCDELPGEIRDVGIQCSPDSIQQMADFLSKNGGAYYQHDNFQGATRMIDLSGGCLQGAGQIEMKRLIAQILTRARYADWSRYRLAEAILHFVQRSIQYAFDEDTTGQSEYGRFPLQTLVDGKGDCECTSILCCALLSYLGFESALTHGESASGTGHVIASLRPPPDLPAFVVTHGDKGPDNVWLYGETTLDASVISWQTSPSGFLAQIKQTVPVPAHPMT